jgi:hypothetical protein
MNVATKKPGKSAPLELLTTIEIIAYRSVLLITFLVYAYKHILAEWSGR